MIAMAGKSIAAMNLRRFTVLILRFAQIFPASFPPHFRLFNFPLFPFN
jgi:hypothetical protein